MAKLDSLNPATGEVIGSLEISTQEDVKAAVDEARNAFKNWKKTSHEERVGYFKKYLELLNRDKEDLARLVSKEMGKPLQESLDDFTFEFGFIEYYINKGPEVLADEFLEEADGTSFKNVYEPYGVCAAIAPWNFPLSMADSAILPTILAGNTVVFKPSEYTSLSQKKFVELLWESGLPKGVVNVVIGDGTVGKILIDSDINLVWFTGSTKVGQEIYAKCGQKFIKGVMELGGSSAGVVFSDADMENALNNLYSARFLNCGQVCNSIKRLFVENSVLDEFVAKLVERLKDKKVGDPLSGANFGPLVSQKQLELLETQVQDAVSKGAKLEIGGKRPEGEEFKNGSFYLPTILTNVDFDMRVMSEEVFGPVLSIMPFDSEEDAISKANNTIYGLSAEVYTSDIDKGERVARELESGTVAINTDAYYYPFCPLGGNKKSGIGREYGRDGLRELTQIKVVATKK